MESHAGNISLIGSSSSYLNTMNSQLSSQLPVLFDQRESNILDFIEEILEIFVNVSERRNIILRFISD